MVYKMIIDLPFEKKQFNSQVKDLRKELEQCKKSGILNNGFEKQLDKLLKIEQEILIELIPYFRVYSKAKLKTELMIKPLQQRGAYCCNNFLENIVRISKNLFITNSTNNRTQFFYLDTGDDYSQSKVEWGSSIIEIKENFSCLYKVDNKKIISIGVNGNLYLILCEDFDNILNINEDITIKHVKGESLLKGLGKSIALRDGFFVVEKDDEKMIVFEITDDGNAYHIIFYYERTCTILLRTAIEKIDTSYFLVGTELGELYFIKYENNRLNVKEKINLLSSEIRQIKRLENEKGPNNSYIVLGNNGEAVILYLNKKTKIIKKEFYNLKGNLFEIDSIKGTAIVLSENGIIYLFEENFGNWNLNKEITLQNTFFIKLIRIDISKYLVIDLDGKLNFLEINRITTTEDLWNLKLY